MAASAPAFPQTVYNAVPARLHPSRPGDQGYRLLLSHRQSPSSTHQAPDVLTRLRLGACSSQTSKPASTPFSSSAARPRSRKHSSALLSVGLLPVPHGTVWALALGISPSRRGSPVWHTRSGLQGPILLARHSPYLRGATPLPGCAGPSLSYRARTSIRTLRATWPSGNVAVTWTR